MTVLSLKILSTRWNSGRSDSGYDDNNGADLDASNNACVLKRCSQWV